MDCATLHAPIAAANMHYNEQQLINTGGVGKASFSHGQDVSIARRCTINISKHAGGSIELEASR